jgi:protease-4
MGGAAASGGYYISAYADKIVAQPTTITGSIGVIGMIPNFEKLFEKINVNWSTVKKGEQADIYSINRKMTDVEYNKIKSSIEGTYEEFLKVVAEGRSMSRDEVHAIAQGRIWSGEQAVANGLVDELGGIEKAKEIMAEMLNCKHLRTVEYSTSESMIEINSVIDTKLQSKLLPVNSELSKQALDLVKTIQLFDNEKTLYWLPWDISTAR